MNDYHNYTSIIDFVKSLKKNKIPEQEFPQRINHFLEIKARRLRIPLVGNFELTPLCNFNCGMCYVHLNATQFNHNDLLTVDQWKSIIKQAYDCGMRTAALTGGECLTYPGFEEIYMYLYSMGIQINIMSNGSLINEERIDFFEKAPPKKIQISLYGSDNDEYEAVTGIRAFDQVYHNLELLRQTHIPVKIAITPNTSMSKNFSPLVETIERVGFPFVISNALIDARTNTGRTVSMLDLDDYIRLHKQVNDKHHIEMKPADPAELPDIGNGDNTPGLGMKCGAGKSSFAIRHDGKICPCVSFSEYSIDVLNSSFRDAWKELNNYVDNYPFPQECIGCAYADVCFLCPAMHKNAPIGHCDPSICERTRRFVLSGLIKIPNK